MRRPEGVAQVERSADLDVPAIREASGGTYVLPILWGDRFVGRVDPQMDRKSEKLLVNSVHAEPGAPVGEEVSSKIGEAIAHLGEFLGAKEVAYTARVPKAWRQSLR